MEAPPQPQPHPDADTLHHFAASLAAEAEQTQLIRKLQKSQRQNAELTAELEAATRKLSRLRQERNLLLDRVYEKEVAKLEFSSGSSDDEDTTTIPPITLTKSMNPSGPTTNVTIAISNTIEATVNNSPTSVINATPPPPPPPSSGRSINNKREMIIEEATTTTSSAVVLDIINEGTKRKRVVKSAEVAAATPRKAQAVAVDAFGQPVLPVTVGVVTLHTVGRIIWDRPTFHNKRYIWPIGFHTSRPYMSAVDGEVQTVYHSTILDGGSGPIFDVYADDNPDQHYQSPTPTGAWTAIVKQVNLIRGRDYSNSASGPDFFGLSNPTISMIIEMLPGTEKCSQYQRKIYETVTSAVSKPPPNNNRSTAISQREGETGGGGGGDYHSTLPDPTVDDLQIDFDD